MHLDCLKFKLSIRTCSVQLERLLLRAVFIHDDEALMSHVNSSSMAPACLLCCNIWICIFIQPCLTAHVNICILFCFMESHLCYWITDISNLQLSNDQRLYVSAKFDPEPHVFTRLNRTSGTQGHGGRRAVGAGRHVQCGFHSSASRSLFVKVCLLLIGRNDGRSGPV